MKTEIQVSIGELVDKLTILDIKKQKIEDPEKLAEVENEYKILTEEFQKIKDSMLDFDSNLMQIYSELQAVNLELWEVEDKIREKEAQKNFRKEFIGLARKVYKLNDQRFDLKNEITTTIGML